MSGCRCVTCAGCGGSGNIWLDFKGRYLGQHRSDDMDEMESCDNCGGSGIIEICDDCYDKEETYATT